MDRLKYQEGVEVEFLPHNPKLPRPLKILQSIKYVRTVVTSVLYVSSLLAKTPACDVIHIFSASYFSYLLSAMPAILIAKLFRRPSILNYRSGEAEDHLRRWRLTAAPTMKLAGRIVVPSGYLIEVFHRFGLKAESIFNAVDTDLFHYHRRKPLEPIFMSGRNLEPLYNVECILRAFNIIQRRFPRARLIVAGDGSRRRALERLSVELGLRNVEFIGAVSPGRMKEIYDAAHIYLNSSNIDNMPASILEAFACGLPVVTTDAGGIPYIVTNEQTALMVPCDDHAALAAAAISLLDRPELAARLVENALAQCSKYRWPEVVGQWIDLYREMALPGGARQVEAVAGQKAPVSADTAVTGLPGAPLGTNAGVDGAPVFMRVLIVAPSMNILGGQAIQAAQIRSMLREVRSVNADLLPINPSLPRPLNLLQRIKYVRTLATTAFYCGSLIMYLPRYDILHVFSASYFSFLLSPTPAMLLGRLLRKKIVLNYHSGEAQDHLRTWRRTAARTMRMADEIVVPSDYLVDVFKEFSLNARAVFNTVDTSLFSFRERCPLKPIFLSNRNLESLYNVRCILRAFSIIQNEYPDARLTVAGDGKERKALEKLAAQLQLKNTLFVGRVSPNRMRDLYDSADIYLNSSNIDNMPVSILESFASGLPVVTTDAGGIPYILRHGQTGLMVERDNYGELAACAIRLLRDQELAQTIVTNARAECEKYRWPAVRDQWIDLYAGLMGHKKTELFDGSSLSRIASPQHSTQQLYMGKRATGASQGASQ